jgi:DNA-binding beta-propeller fold protein YncE
MHSASKETSPSGYHLLKRMELGGEGGWDLLSVDNAARRLYVSRSTHVMVVDVDSAQVVGDIPGTNGVHDIAVAPDLGRGFATCGRDSSVTIFDLKTLKELGKVSVRGGPDAIVYDPATHRVLSFSPSSSSATAIEAAEGKPAGTISLGGRPELGAADGKGMVYVNLEDKSEVVALDSRKLEVKAHWPLAPGEGPTGMAIDPEHRRLFITCGNKKMIVMNADDGHVVADLPIGEGVDGAVFDPATQLAFSSNGEGTLTVVHEDSPDEFRVLENVPTQRGARTMALDPRTHNLFLPTAQFGPPPAATPEHPHPRPSIVPGSFVLLVFGQ